MKVKHKTKSIPCHTMEKFKIKGWSFTTALFGI